MADLTPQKPPDPERKPDGEIEGSQKSIVSASFPPEAEKALEKVVEEGGPKALMAIFGAFSRTTTFGPDPQTAKVMAEVDIHAEDCRLKGYQDSLKSRDQQNERDHAFRKKRLNHETSVQIIALAASIAAGAMGLYLYTHGQAQLGGYILFGSFFVLYSIISGKMPSSPPKP